MQLQFRAEYKKYIGLQQRSGEPESNRLLAEMVKKGCAFDTQAMLREMEARKNGNGRKPSSSNKENTPVQSTGQPNMGSANIDKIIQFIEGGPHDEAAFKKAQKKARQKQKKDEERKQREEEEEALRKAEEARIRKEQQLAEQQRVKEELALQKQLKKLNQKKKQQQPVQPPPSNDSKSKKKKGKQQQQQSQVIHNDPDPDPEPEHYEQTIPAMVTIKRIVENNNSPPTVTITLKGSTPDQDKLLYTLVNGHDAPIITTRCPPEQQNSKKQNGGTNNKQTNDKQKKKTKGASSSNSVVNTNTGKNKENVSVKHVQTSEIKVQLAIDSSFRKDLNQAKSQKQKQQPTTTTSNNNNNNNNKKSVNVKKQEVKPVKEVKTVKEVKKQPNAVKTSNSNSNSSSSLASQNDIIDIPSIKLPPGITITKVSGPLTNRKSATTQVTEYPDVPVSKSGVIVVDTEKLIQQQTGNGTNGTSSNGKKKKKKAKKAAAAAAVATGNTTNTNVSVVTTSVTTRNADKPRVLIKSAENASNISTPSSSGMVTLKNPIFHPLSGMQKPPSDGESGMQPMVNMNEQATISHGENGMVTIRRPRPVGFMPSNESSISDYLAKNVKVTETNMAATIVTTSPHAVKPNMAATISALPPQPQPQPQTKNPPILTPWQMPDTSFSALSEERKIIKPPSPRGVQWPRADCENGKINTPSVLQGLPGIEITRVRTGSPVVEAEYVEPPANVSIIRTGGYKVTDKPQSWAYSAQQ